MFKRGRYATRDGALGDDVFNGILLMYPGYNIRRLYNHKLRPIIAVNSHVIGKTYKTYNTHTLRLIIRFLSHGCATLPLPAGIQYNTIHTYVHILYTYTVRFIIS